jgi:hypothetical protein
MDKSTDSSRTDLLNELLANNSAYASGFDEPMTLGVKKKVRRDCNCQQLSVSILQYSTVLV